MLFFTIGKIRFASMVLLLTSSAFGFAPPQLAMRSRASLTRAAPLWEQPQSRPPDWRVFASVLRNDAVQSPQSKDIVTPTEVEMASELAELCGEIAQLKFELAQRPLPMLEPTGSVEITHWYKKLPLWNKEDTDNKYDELSIDNLRRLNKEQLQLMYAKLRVEYEDLEEHARQQEVRARYALAERDEQRRNMITLRHQLQDEVKAATGKFDYQVSMRALDRKHAVAELEEARAKHAKQLQTALDAQEAAWKQRVNLLERDLKEIRIKLKGAEERISVRGDLLRQSEGEKRSFRAYVAIGWTLLWGRVSRPLERLRPPPRASVHSIDELILTQKK
jgi:predicted acetyltransferase